MSETQSSSYNLRWRGLPPEVRVQVWSYCLANTRPISIIDSDVPVYTITTTSSTANKLKTGSRLDLLSLLLISWEDQHMISESFFIANSFLLKASCASIQHFLAHQLAPSHRLLLRNVHISSRAMYYYDVGNQSFRTLATYLSQCLDLHSLTLHTYEGQNGLIDAWFQCGGKAVFDGRIRELRVQYDIGPFFPVSVPEALLAGRLLYAEYEENYDALCGGLAGDVGNTPMLSRNWTRLMGADERREEAIRECRDLYPFEIVLGSAKSELGDENLVLVLRERDTRVLELRIRTMEETVERGRPHETKEWESLSPLVDPELAERIRSARVGIESLQQRQGSVLKEKRKLYEDACVPACTVPFSEVKIVRPGQDFWLKTMFP